MKTYLVLDCPNLLYRAFHTTGNLTNGTIFGFLKSLLFFQTAHDTRDFIFCFDHSHSLRTEVYPDYKANRTSKLDLLSNDDYELFSTFQREITRLRTEILYDIGYRNIFHHPGYEADDLIASFVLNSLPADEQAIIISSDKDLYQLLGDRVKIWKPQPKTFYDAKSLKDEYGIDSPSQWSMVKALSGCLTDNVYGIKGIGEVTAAKYVNGTLKDPCRARQKIQMNSSIWQRNLPLVKLPYEGTPVLPINKDGVSLNTWNAVVRGLGMNALVRLR